MGSFAAAIGVKHRHNVSWSGGEAKGGGLSGLGVSAKCGFSLCRHAGTERNFGMAGLLAN